MEDGEFFFDRNGYIEETYLSWNMIPMRDDDGKTEGFWNTVFETTREKLAQRRIKTLIQLASPPTMISFWDEILEGFESNERDLPFALVYSIPECNGRSAQDAMFSEGDFRFEAALGLDAKESNYRRDGSRPFEERFLPLLRKAQSRLESICVFSASDESLPKGIFHGLQWRGFGEEPQSVAVISVKARGIEYYLLLGLNPRKAYDGDYEQFIELLNRQLATSITSADLMDQARINQAKLSRQVADGEARFKIMTETNPAGMFYISPQGEVLYANDTSTGMGLTVAARKSQERFMDITSHEMRNPLSAILQSADGIVSSMLELESTNSKDVPSEIAQSTLEAAQTVMLCAQHQARIINDVLTLSKLDSAMVQIAPIAVEPDTVVQATLDMFSRELASLDIDLDFRLEDTYKKRGIEWVRTF
ncbi:MAG: hypothetical protein Q9208_007540 [Pyrenodesmia sp. 3 TL-2023]